LSYKNVLRQEKNWTISFLTLLLLVTPQFSFAHLVSARFGEFYSGLLHPVTTFMHLLPWIAMGLLSSQQVAHSARWILLVFPAAAMTGTSLGLLLPDFSVVAALNPLLNIASFIVLGVIVVLGLRLQRTVFCLLACFVGLTHGYANGMEELRWGAGLLYVAGVTIAAYLSMAMITAGAILLARQWPWGPLGVKVMGSWVVAVGVVFAGFSVLNLPLVGA